FFFSSRRRHTRCLSDWSSDVCSSDLLYLWWQDDFPNEMDPQLWAWVDRLIFDSQTWKDFDKQMRLVETAEQEAKQRIILCDLNRSEERRVGKECRSWRGACHGKEEI